MVLGRGCESFFYLAEPDRIVDSGRLRAFGGYHRTGIEVKHVPEVAEGLTLEHFVMLLDSGQVGVIGEELAPLTGDLKSEFRERPLPEHNATVVSVTA
jgi:hypothetical protein